jgi:predicted nucleic acid-binding protein
MTLPLSAFNGEALYVDAMLLVAFIDPVSPWNLTSRQLFQRAVAPVRPIRLVTSTLTLDETVFVLLEELVARPPFGVTRSRSQYLSAHPEVVRQLTGMLAPPVQALQELLSLEPVLPEDVTAMRREMAASGLLPRDALHLAVMRRLGLTDLASDDVAFDRCPGISRYTP